MDILVLDKTSQYYLFSGCILKEFLFVSVIIFYICTFKYLIFFSYPFNLMSNYAHFSQDLAKDIGTC